MAARSICLKFAVGLGLVAALYRPVRAQEGEDRGSATGPGQVHATVDRIPTELPGSVISDARPRTAQENAPGPEATKDSNPEAASSEGACSAREPGLFARCRHRLQRWFLGFPEEWEPKPFGDSIVGYGRAMVASGDSARMILYQCDFIEGSEQLSVKGKDQLAKIVQLLPINFSPVVVERTPLSPGLDESRRVTVLTELARMSFPVPPDRVVVGAPIAVGMQGAEAELVDQSFQGQTKSAGGKGGSGSNGFGSTGFGAK